MHADEVSHSRKVDILGGDGYLTSLKYKKTYKYLRNIF